MSIPVFIFNKSVDLLMSILKDWRFEAAAVIAALSVLILVELDSVSWVKGLPPWSLGVIFIVGILFGSHLLICGADCIRIKFLKSREGRILQPYNKLSEKQKDFLTRIYRNNSRKFRLEHKPETKLKRDIGYRYPTQPYLQTVGDNLDEIPQIPRILAPHEAEFEDLISYNYIEAVSQISRPEVYSVTKNGWNELKKKFKMKSG